MSELLLVFVSLVQYFFILTPTILVSCCFINYFMNSSIWFPLSCPSLGSAFTIFASGLLMEFFRIMLATFQFPFVIWYFKQTVMIKKSFSHLAKLFYLIEKSSMEKVSEKSVFIKEIKSITPQLIGVVIFMPLLRI